MGLRLINYYYKHIYVSFPYDIAQHTIHLLRKLTLDILNNISSFSNNIMHLQTGKSDSDYGAIISRNF